jgi:hypothetical protein
MTTYPNQTPSTVQPPPAPLMPLFDGAEPFPANPSAHEHKKRNRKAQSCNECRRSVLPLHAVLDKT